MISSGQGPSLSFLTVETSGAPEIRPRYREVHSAHTLRRNSSRQWRSTSYSIDFYWRTFHTRPYTHVCHWHSLNFFFYNLKKLTLLRRRQHPVVRRLWQQANALLFYGAVSHIPRNHFGGWGKFIRNLKIPMQSINRINSLSKTWSIV